MLRNCFLIFFLIFGWKTSFGQNLQKMHIWQDSLLNLGQKIFATTSEMEKLESNFSFVRTLVSSLKEPNSYYYSFDQLKMISVVNAPDDKFRIFSWNVPLQDGSYLYYGAIQLRSGNLKLIPLLDKTFEIKDVDKDVVDNNNWYGAQYYEIIPFQNNKYILLGWKGHRADFTQKVIDVLNFDSDDKISFGQAVFSDKPTLVRKIFSYNRQATMILQYNKANNRIEFDNLVAVEGKEKKDYVPDLSHNAYIIKNNKLLLEENIEVLNQEGFDLPNSPSKNPKSGL